MRSVGGDACGKSTRLETPQATLFGRGGSSRAPAKKTLRQTTVGKFKQMLHLCPLGASIHRKRIT
ncbi:hypothetical protein GCM10008935_13320 [Alkalibacillus silvisoli]|uniref:Uncharacterized protein n=1 Tax=Alkalibacillus silvisoli TaxID=392823 RepID=A0ABN0ZUF0_9BACI